MLITGSQRFRLRDEMTAREVRRRAEMKTGGRVVLALVVIGAAVSVGLEVWRRRTRAEALAATSDFSGERAFRDLEQLVKLGPRPPGSHALEEAREYIAGELSA